MEKQRLNKIQKARQAEIMKRKAELV